MRVAPACQLSLPVGQAGGTADRWWQLPEEARAQVLVLLARLIARSVLAGDVAAGEPVPDGGMSRG